MGKNVGIARQLLDDVKLSMVAAAVVVLILAVVRNAISLNTLLTILFPVVYVHDVRFLL